ncbi:putative tubulin polyglutamylase TTLL2 [Acipenser oxyrinchus oxyrinchus]|uniref:Tubulin polyglutamylase TTLL2 n=1 Tax=Acipenser oxyrinchus oxyrinchus TaxID=40147 RepID=A0AAD8GBP9_ACIOX|nr:putative tubulin polyglutamylase TTLL2 [Acipenser oxyrinchus oxyrinchus]
MASGDASEVVEKPLVFRLHEGAPEVVREVLLERGWVEYDEQEQEEGDWNLYWRASTFRSCDFDNILPWQRLNHHPKTMGITRKDNLARNLKRMKGIFGPSLYDFSPIAFILPNDYTKFVAEYTKDRYANGGKPGYWICKPVDLSRGRGIFIFEDIQDLAYDSPVIVQKYISNPLLISGYKLDLRIYVCVSSFHPLTVYMYQEGLVRFATEKYKLTSLNNLLAHLTNTSINKFGPAYTMDKERVGPGCKWTMSKFRCFLHSQNIDEILLWQRINNIVTLTLLTIAPSIPPTPNCIELFGFDILIDDNFKPWLLEVNYSPALSLDCPTDVTVKTGLLYDLVDLLNYKKIDSQRQSGYLKQWYKGPRYLSTQSLGSANAPVFHPKAMYKPKEHIDLTHNRSFSRSSVFYQNSNKEAQSDESESFATKGCSTSCDSRTQIYAYNREDGTEASRPNICWDTKKCPVLSKEPAQVQWAISTTNKKTSAVRTQAVPQNKERLGAARKRPSLKQSSLGLCKLPSIHIQRYKPASFPWNSKANENIRPQSRVGDFILTFPFNEATYKASRSTVNVKIAVQEVQKLIKRLVSSELHKVKRRKAGSFSNSICSSKECVGPLLWGPKDPPLLSDCCSHT